MTPTDDLARRAREFFEIAEWVRDDGIVPLEMTQVVAFATLIADEREAKMRERAAQMAEARAAQCKARIDTHDPVLMGILAAENEHRAASIRALKLGSEQ